MWRSIVLREVCALKVVGNGPWEERLRPAHRPAGDICMERPRAGAQALGPLSARCTLLSSMLARQPQACSTTVSSVRIPPSHLEHAWLIGGHKRSHQCACIRHSVHTDRLTCWLSHTEQPAEKERPLGCSCNAGASEWAFARMCRHTTACGAKGGDKLGLAMWYGVTCARMCRHAAACGAAAREGAREGGCQLVYSYVPAHSIARLAHCTPHRYHPGWSPPISALVKMLRSCIG